MVKQTQDTDQVTGWVGWVYFAGFLLLLNGFFQIIAGLVALLNDEFYGVVGSTLVVFDVTTWGWVHLLMGILLLVVGSSLFDGKKWARVVAVILATISVIAQFAFLSVYPIWSLLSIAVGILVIYALTVHGSESELK